MNYLEVFLGTLVYLTGIVLLPLFLISANTNYRKNRSYSIGAIFIVSMIFIRHLSGALSAKIGMDLLGFIHSFLFKFGLIMIAAILFFIFMYCIQLLIERIR